MCKCYKKWCLLCNETDFILLIVSSVLEFGILDLVDFELENPWRRTENFTPKSSVSEFKVQVQNTWEFGRKAYRKFK